MLDKLMQSSFMKGPGMTSIIGHARGLYQHAAPGIVAGALAGGIAGGATSQEGFKNRAMGAGKGMMTGALYGGLGGAAAYGVNRFASGGSAMLGKPLEGAKRWSKDWARGKGSKGLDYMSGATGYGRRGHAAGVLGGAGIGAYATLRSNQGY